jgi:hypothetical protein
MIDERDSRIHISQLELMAFIGVPDQERVLRMIRNAFSPF